MMEVWEKDNEVIYSLLVRVADLYDMKEGTVDDNDKLYSFQVVMEDLWELNCGEKLHSLLTEMIELWKDIDDEKLFSLMLEMVDLWKDSKGKLNKEKLYSWLAKITDLWEEDKLFRLLERMAFLEGPNEEHWKDVEGVRNDLRFMLNFLNKLEDQESSHGHMHYFISDVVEMAHDVQLLAHVYMIFLEEIRETKSITSIVK